MTARQKALPKAVVRAATRLAVWLYRRSGGAIGGRKSGMPLLLTTIGRRSGRPWTVPLMYCRDGERLVVVAANGGSDNAPAWWLNLRAEPRATAQLGRERVVVTAVEASGAERDRLWPLLVEAYAGYGRYAMRTTRALPVVVLERRG
jgi:deazaflavin-dependent oxidoreductase (nitroreductase family)